MASMTYAVTVDDTAWVQVADGASHSSFGFHLASGPSVRLYIGDAAPTLNETNVVTLTGLAGKTGSSFSLDLPSAMGVWARATKGSVLLQGYRVPV